jgi:D-aspartate ligase
VLSPAESAQDLETEMTLLPLSMAPDVQVCPQLQPLPRPAGVVITGADYRALFSVRSLGRRGIPVVVLQNGEQLLASASRHVKKTIRWRRQDESRDVQFFLRLADQEGLSGWLLMPTDDAAVGMIARSHQLLGTRYTLTTPFWELLKYSCDKRLLHELAGTLGIDSPFTVWPSGRAELERLDWCFPAIIKPALRELDNPLTSAKAWSATNRRELLRLYDKACQLMPAGSVMIQEFIPGGGESQFSFAALCCEGRVLASLVARRTRQYPADFGRASTFVETVEDPGIVEPSIRLLSALQMTGLVEVEFKRDLQGNFKLLDVNPRMWGWHSLCARAGVDFTYLLWLLAQGEPIPPLQGVPGYSWMRLSTDFPIALQAILRGQLSVRAWLRSVFDSPDSPIFDIDDLVPGLLEFPLLLYAVARRASPLKRLSQNR